MVEQHLGRARRIRHLARRAQFRLELDLQVFEAGEEQGVLVTVVGVERRAADVGAVEDVLDRDLLIALLEHQGEERVVECPAGAADAAVFHGPPFPDSPARVSGTGRIPRFAC